MELWGEEARGEWTLEVQHSTAKPHLGRITRSEDTVGETVLRIHVLPPPPFF